MKTTREYVGGDRYQFDCGECAPVDGWAQVDTQQDSGMFGTWANPFERIVFTFAEGDICRQECDSAAEFAETMRRLAEWNRENEMWVGIDDMGDPNIRKEFIELGLESLLSEDRETPAAAPA